MLSWYGQDFLGRAESSTLATDPGRIPVSTQHYAQIAQSPIHSDLSGVVCFQGQIVHSSTHLNSVSPTREESPPFRRSPAAQPFVYSSPGYKTHLLQRRCKIFWLVSLFLFANIRISEKPQALLLPIPHLAANLWISKALSTEAAQGLWAARDAPTTSWHPWLIQACPRPTPVPAPCATHPCRERPAVALATMHTFHSRLTPRCSGSHHLRTQRHQRSQWSWRKRGEL